MKRPNGTSRPKEAKQYYLAMLYRVGDTPFKPLTMACLDAPSASLTLSTGQVVQFGLPESSVRGRSGKGRQLRAAGCSPADSKGSERRGSSRRTNKCSHSRQTS